MTHLTTLCCTKPAARHTVIALKTQQEQTAKESPFKSCGMGLSSARLQESGSKAEIRKFDRVGIYCGCSVASLSGPMTVSIDFGHSDENVKCVDPDEVGAALGWRQRLVAALKSIRCRLRHVMQRCGGCCKLKCRASLSRLAVLFARKPPSAWTFFSGLRVSRAASGVGKSSVVLLASSG